MVDCQPRLPLCQSRPAPVSPSRCLHADSDIEPRSQVSYVIFHYVTGVPFDMTNNSGVYDNLTLWEQIDSGAQYTPAKKWLTTLPIVL